MTNSSRMIMWVIISLTLIKIEFTYIPPCLQRGT